MWYATKITTSVLLHFLQERKMINSFHSSFQSSLFQTELINFMDVNEFFYRPCCD
jgi:hypothetical protein